MNCTDAREYFFAFLDNELDAHLSIEVQRHLEHCPDCAQQVEIEREVRKALTASMRGAKVSDPGPLPRFDQQALGAMLSAGDAAAFGHQKTFHRRRLAQLIGVAAAVGLCIGGWWFLRSDADQSRRAGDLVDLVVEDYEHFLQSGGEVQLASADAQTVSTWLRDQTGLSVSFSDMKGHRCKLIGARKCKLAGQTAAFALYDLEGTPVSLMVTRDTYVNLTRMQRVEDRVEELWFAQFKGCRVVAKPQGGLLYAAVSTLPKEELIHLIESAVHESN